MVEMDVFGAESWGYDPTSPAFQRDPYPSLRQLQLHRPVYWTWHLGTWILTRHADIVPLLKDRRLGVVPASVRQLFLGDGPAFALSEKVLGLIDPPDHTRLRGLVSRAFTPRSVEALRPRIQQLVDGLIDAVLPRREFDLMAELALPLPVLVISELLGVPTSDVARFKLWTERLLLIFDSPMVYTDARVAACHEAAAELSEYLQWLIEIKRSDPRSDLISQLIAAEAEGDKLSAFEVIQMSANLMLGGYETTMGLIGNGVRAMLQQPEQYALLVRRPELARAAVEECLRFDTPFTATVRTALEPLEVGGQTIQAGQLVCLLLAAANRDPEVYLEPDRLDITRSTPNVAFGGGMHLCLGAPLARLEGTVVFETLARRLPDLRILPGEHHWRDSQITRILTALPVAA